MNIIVLLMCVNSHLISVNSKKVNYLMQHQNIEKRISRIKAQMSSYLVLIDYVFQLVWMMFYCIIIVQYVIVMLTLQIGAASVPLLPSRKQCFVL
jgi:hypothetical protein